MQSNDVLYSKVQLNTVQLRQCSAVQCSAVQSSAVQCRAVQCSAVQCSAVQCSAVQCSAVQTYERWLFLTAEADNEYQPAPRIGQSPRAQGIIKDINSSLQGNLVQYKKSAQVWLKICCICLFRAELPIAVGNVEERGPWLPCKA